MQGIRQIHGGEELVMMAVWNLQVQRQYRSAPVSAGFLLQNPCGYLKPQILLMPPTRLTSRGSSCPLQGSEEPPEASVAPLASGGGGGGTLHLQIIETTVSTALVYLAL